MELARVWKRYHLVQQVADLEHGAGGDGGAPRLDEDLVDDDGLGL